MVSVSRFDVILCESDVCFGCVVVFTCYFILSDIALVGYEMIIATHLVGYPSSHIQRALVGHRQAKVQKEIAVCA